MEGWIVGGSDTVKGGMERGMERGREGEREGGIKRGMKHGGKDRRRDPGLALYGTRHYQIDAHTHTL